MITPLERARQIDLGAGAGPAPVARPPLAGRETALLVALALITEAVYLFGFVLPYPLAGNFTHPLLDLNRLNNHTPVSANYFALTWAISFAAMYIAYRRCPARPGRAYFAALGAAALVFNLTLLLMYPTGAADLFDQIFRARELAVYGKNPFVFAPNNPIFAEDPFRPFVGGWAGTTSPYGPAWESLAALTSKLAGDDLWRNILYFKGLVILAYAGAAALIYATLRRTRPEWAARGLLFFAWNPLLLWETAGNGHNDMVMILFTVLALYLLAAPGRLPLLAPVALALAALSKFVPALLLPLALVALWRMRQAPVGAPRAARAAGRVAGAQAALLGLAGFLLTSALVYAPFWAGPRTIGALARQDLFTASLANSLKDTLLERFGVDEAQAMDLARSAATLIVGVTVVGCALWLLYVTRGRARNDVLDATYSAAYTVFFVYLVFGTLWFQPWYQGWLIALTPLTARLATGKRTLVMNAGGVANYFVWDFLVLWNYSWGSVIQWTSALTVNLPVLLYTIYQWLVPEQGAQAAGRPPPGEEGMQHP
jgi:hypothetical protein